VGHRRLRRERGQDRPLALWQPADAYERGRPFQYACLANTLTTTAFGAALTTPAMLAGVDNAQRFSVIVDG